MPALAASGSNAMHAVLSCFRKQRITQYDMKCRMFDILIEPVMSYASHMSGPELLSRDLFKPANQRNNAADKVQLAFLRAITGTGSSSSIEVLMRYLHRSPVLHHWAHLAARWWGRLQGIPVAWCDRQPGVHKQVVC
jgi:hypothetical protein